MATIALTEAEFGKTITGNGIVFVDFWAAWCGPCRMFGPVFEAASEAHPDAVFAKVDTDDQRGLAGDLDISSIPTLMAFRDGYLVYREAGAEHVRVEAFIADMQRAYAWADLVLCRAGGSSMAEITAAGLPAVLVPLPWAAQDHQRHNARFLESEGGAVVLEQSSFYVERSDKAPGEANGAGQRAGQPTRQVAGHEEAGPRLFVRTVLSLLQDRPTLEAMARKSLAAARPYAARDLVNELEALIAG